MKHYVFLMGGVGNVLFQISYALTLKPCANVILVDTKPRGRFLRLIYPLTIHSDWLGIEQIARNLDLEVRPPNCLQWGLLAALYGLRKLFKRDSEFQIAGAKYHIGYFQDVEYSEGIIGRMTSVIANQLPAADYHQEDTESHYLLVHARGFDFSPAARLNLAQIDRVASRFERAIIVGNDKKFEAEISYKLSVANRSSDPRSDFVAIGSAKHVLCADSTFCFWATLAHSPWETTIFTKRHSVFFRYSNLFGIVEAIDE